MSQANLELSADFTFLLNEFSMIIDWITIVLSENNGIMQFKPLA